MQTNNTVTHFLAYKNKFRCGKFPTGINSYSINKNEVTCRVCSEGIGFDGGEIEQYSIGGHYNKKGVERELVNHYSYKEIYFEQKKQLQDAQEIIEKIQFIPRSSFEAAELFNKALAYFEKYK